MSQHIFFNDDGEVIEDTACAVALLADKRDDDSSSEYLEETHEEEEEEEEEEDDEEEEDGNSDSSNSSFHNMCSHATSPNTFRAKVNMEVYISLHHHLAVVQEMKQPAILTLFGRVAEYIGWIMHTKAITQTDAVQLLLNTPLMVLQYIAVLKGDHKFKNGTIYNTLIDFKQWAKYLAIYENQVINNFVITCSDQQKIESRKKTKDVRHRLTLENLIENRQWPTGGKQELSDLLNKEKPHVDRTIKSAIAGKLLAESDLTFANNWIIALVFVENPQGRSQAIGAMSIDCLEDLRDNQMTLSSQFKTQATYDSQSINCNETTFQYISAYVNYIRPHFVSDKPSNALFLTRQGVPYSNIGACVTRLFRGISKYHITTTRLRAMFETEVNDAVEQGVLTVREGADVTRNSGHGSAVARSHYLKRRTEESSQSARQAHQKLYNSSVKNPPTLVNADDVEFVPQKEDEDEDEDEEEQSTRRRRINWSEDELWHLSTWVAQEELKKGKTKNWRACLAVMQATDVFPASHLTTVALRDASRREVKKANKQDDSMM